MAKKIIGYFVYEGDLHVYNVLILIDDGAEGKYTWFNPIRGYTEVDKSFKDGCDPISKEQYIQTTTGYETPEEYL